MEIVIKKLQRCVSIPYFAKVLLHLSVIEFSGIEFNDYAANMGSGMFKR